MGSRFRPDDIWDLEWFDWTNELTNVTSTSSQASLRRIRVSRGSLEPSANRLRRIRKTEDDWERG